MNVNEKVVLELIGLAVTCVLAYKEITLAKISAQKEVAIAQASSNLVTEVVQ